MNETKKNERNEGIRRSIFGKGKGSVEAALEIHREDYKEYLREQAPPKKSTLFLENDYRCVTTEHLYLEEHTIGTLKNLIESIHARTNLGVRADQFEVFYPYHKMWQDDDAGLLECGVTSGTKKYYRVRPGENIMVP